MASVSKAPATVVEAASLCAQSFAQIHSTLQSTHLLDPQSECEFKDQLGRFKIWAGNLGVFATDTTSVDFRLKDNQDVKDVLINMLTRLRKQVEQLGQPSVLPTLPEEQVHHENKPEPPESQGSSTASSSSWKLSSDSDSAASTRSVPSDPQRRYGSLTEIVDIVNRLYRIYAVIRKPVSLSEHARVAEYTKNSLDLEDFESYVKWQIRLWYPDTTVELIDRLSDTVVLRRKKLLYRERHQQKLNEGTEDWFNLRNPESIYDESQKPFTPGQIEFLHVGSVQGPTARVRKSVAFSATKASTIDHLAISAYAKSVAISGVTKSAVARREQLDVPAPPKPQSGLKAKCPYCSKFLTKEESKKARWTSVSLFHI